MEDTVKIKEEELSHSPSDEMFRGEGAVNMKTEQPIAAVFITELKREPEGIIGNVLKDEREDEEDGLGGTPLSRNQVSPIGSAEIGKKQKQREEDETKNNHRVVVWSICHKEDFMEQMSELVARSSEGVGREEKSALSTVSCGICNEILENVSVLHKHVKIQHDEQQSASPNSNSIPTVQPVHKCGICSREFKRFGSLYQHAKVHAEDRRYLCKKCGRTWSALQKHEAVSVKDRRFLCSACGMTFFELHSLKRHIITHFTESNHTCKICNKSFASYSHLRTHLLTHSEAAYSCNTCG